MALTVVAALVVTVLAFGASAPAGACGDAGFGADLPGPFTRVAYSFTYERCPDGLAQLNGTLYDTNCDGMDAYARFRLYDSLGGGSYSLRWTRNASTTNGCGASTAFDFSGATAGTVGGYLETCQWAANSLGGTNTYCHNRNF